MRLTALHSFVVLALSSARSSNAGLYPTQPVANTVFHGGEWNTITWIDSSGSDSQTPLDALGKMQVDLWIDGDAPVSLTFESSGARPGAKPCS